MTGTIVTEPVAGPGRAAGAAAAGRVVLTIGALTLREAARRKVLRALAVLTLVLLALSAWGFAKLGGFQAEFGELTSGEARLVASQLLNLVMFGLSMIAALGTAFLAGPTLGGEIESGMALSMLARPVPRFAVLLGKWLGLVGFGAGFVTVAGLAQFVIVQLTVGYWPPEPVLGLALLAAQTAVLLTLGLLLSTLVSPMASGIVAVGLFGAAWIAGVVGGVGGGAGERRGGPGRHDLADPAADRRALARGDARVPAAGGAGPLRQGDGRLPVSQPGPAGAGLPALGAGLGAGRARPGRAVVPPPRPVTASVPGGGCPLR